MWGLGACSSRGLCFPASPLTERSEVYTNHRVSSALFHSALVPARGPQDPAAGPVRLPVHFQRPQEFKFPEVGVPEVGSEKARATMLAEAPGPVAPFKATPDQAQSQPGYPTLYRSRKGRAVPDFPDWFRRTRTPGSTLKSCLPYLRSLDLPYFFPKSLRKPKAPPVPNSLEQEGILHPAPFPLPGAGEPQSPRAKSGHDTGAKE